MAQFSGQAPASPCGSHGKWLTLVKTWDTELRRFIAAESRYDAPLVAELGNPLAHELALESLSVGADFDLTTITNGVVGWTAIEADRCQAPSAMPAPTDHGAEAGDPGNCPDTVPPGHKLQLKIPDLVSVTVDCENVSVSVEGEGLIAPFVSGERTFTGETTIFGGVKAGAELGPFGGELQEGFYIKSGRAASRTLASGSRPLEAGRRGQAWWSTAAPSTSASSARSTTSPPPSGSDRTAMKSYATLSSNSREGTNSFYPPEGLRQWP